MNPRTGCALICLTALLGGCSDAEEARLFSREEAESTVRAWSRALMQGDAKAMAEQCQLPFRFRTRTWKSAEEMMANLEREMPGLLDELRASELEVDYFAFGDLIGGQWPRGKVPDDPEEQCRRLGIQEDGYLAWFHVGRRPVLELVLNPDRGGRKLQVSALLTSR